MGLHRMLSSRDWPSAATMGLFRLRRRRRLGITDTIVDASDRFRCQQPSR